MGFLSNNDELSNASAKYSMSHSKYFSKGKVDLEYFGLSFIQRAMAFVACLVLGGILFFYSMTQLLFIAFSPVRFTVPYVFSNFLFFIMFGFASGFKTYMKRLLDKRKRVISLLFVSFTILTMLSSMLLHSRIINIVLSVIQIVLFICFTVSFFPGGADGINAILSTVFKW